LEKYIFSGHCSAHDFCFSRPVNRDIPPPEIEPVDINIDLDSDTIAPDYCIQIGSAIS
jgi:hypothetical protein